MNKKARGVAKYTIIVSFFLAIFVSMFFALAGHVVRTSGGATAYNVNEDVGFIYNISVNNTDPGEAANITEVNITLPSNFTLISGSNGTSAADVDNVNTSTVLSWRNFSGGYVVNGSNITQYFWFNSTVSYPGSYNITISTLNSSGASSSTIAVTVNDTTAPFIVDFVSPTVGNVANLSQLSIPINVSVVDAYSNINTVRVYLSNSTDLINNTNFTVTAATNASGYINITAPRDGRYFINVTANDSAGNQNLTGAYRIVTLDRVAPLVQFGLVTTNESNLSQNWIFANITASDNGDAGLSLIKIYLYNSSGIYNSTALSTSSPYAINFTSLPVGTYTLNASANDSAGNINYTSSRVIIADSVNPLISYGSGSEDAISYLARTNIYVNVSVTEANERNITFSLFNSSGLANSTTFTDGTRSINWTGLSLGNYNYSVTIRDAAGNSNSTAVRFAYLVNYWAMNGTTYDVSGRALNNTIVNITIWSLGNQGPALNFSVSTNTNASGWFSLNIPQDTNWMYKPVIRHFNSSTGAIDYIGQSLPQFPYSEFANTTGLNFYLRDAGTINITVLNSTGTGLTAFNYMIKDTTLGYDVESNWLTYVTEAIVYVPRDKNYSIMVYPNASLPVSFNWNNFSASGDYGFNYSSRYNATTKVLEKRFNTTMTLATVEGFARNQSSWGNWTEFKIVPYLLEPGNMVSKQYGALPYNMSSWNQTTYSDTYTLSTGAYLITVPAPAETVEYLLFATAKNGTGIYGGYRNVSISYGGSVSSLNFTLYPLMSTSWGSANSNFTLNKALDWTPINISSAQQAINLVNISNSTLTDLTAHVETTVDYSAYGAREFTFMSEVATGSASTLYLPLLNVTGIKEMNVYTQSYAPKRVSFTPSTLLSNNNITLTAFDPGAIDGSIEAGLIDIGLYISNSSCDVPTIPSSCIIGSSDQDMENFNPLAAIIGGGKLSFRMGTGNISVHYVNVDMMASGPPDALFDSNTTQGTSGSFESALRFGSGGPTIYDYVLVSIPYTEGSSSQTGLNESAQVNISIPVFYDESWGIIWNATNNGTNATGLAGNYTHYSNKQSEWQYLLSTTTCGTNASAINASQPCYIDTSTNKIWIRLPHFSGTGPKVSGSVITAASTPAANNPSGGSSDDTTAYWTNNIYLDNQELSALGTVNRALAAKERVIIKIKGTQHTVGIMNLTADSALINVSSVSQKATLTLRESKKFDVENDSYYDIKVTLNSISNSKADITIESINEKVVAQDSVNQNITAGKPDENQPGQGNQPGGNPAADNEKSNKAITWVLIIIVVLVVILLVAVIVMKKHSNLKRVGLR